MKTISESALRVRLRTAVKVAGSEAAFAAMHGISAQYVNDCIRNQKGIGRKIAVALGYAPVRRYRKLEGGE